LVIASINLAATLVASSAASLVVDDDAVKLSVIANTSAAAVAANHQLSARLILGRLASLWCSRWQLLLTTRVASSAASVDK